MWQVLFTEQIKKHPKMGPWFLRAQRYGVWPFACALFAASLVVIIPLFLLIIAGALVGVSVFLISSLIVWIITSIQDLWDRIRGIGPNSRPGPPDDAGRENVRIID